MVVDCHNVVCDGDVYANHGSHAVAFCWFYLCPCCRCCLLLIVVVCDDGLWLW